MEFLKEDALDVLITWAEKSPVCLMISGPNGEIFWCNEAFERFMGYTHRELMQLGWKRISSDDEDLAADIEAVEECVAGKRTVYSVRKKYVPKNEKPQWGEMSAVRFPLDGELKWFLCTWHPLQNGNAAAFTTALEHITMANAAMSDLKEAVKACERELAKTNEHTEPQRLLLLTAKVAFAHPKTTWAIIITAASLVVSANVLTILKNVAGIDTTIVTPQVEPATEIAEVRQFDLWHPVTLTTPAGNVLQIGGDQDGMRDGTSGLGRSPGVVRRFAGAIRRAGESDFWSDWASAGGDSGITVVPSEQWRRSDSGGI